MQAIGYALAGAVIALGAFVIVRLIRSWRDAYGGDARRDDDPAA